MSILFMQEALKIYIENKISITDDEFNRIAALGFTKKLRRRQYLLQEGEICKYVSFVLRGCLRTYTVDAKGQEHITSFAKENWWPGPLAHTNLDQYHLADLKARIKKILEGQRTSE
jgi:CRP-like cAMP-binding protein